MALGALYQLLWAKLRRKCILSITSLEYGFRLSYPARYAAFILKLCCISLTCYLQSVNIVGDTAIGRMSQ